MAVLRAFSLLGPLCFVAVSLVAETASKLPIPMQDAITRFANPAVTPNWAASHQFSAPPPEAMVTMPEQPIASCSIPLLPMHVDRPEQYTMRRYHTMSPAAKDEMPHANVAPACKNWR